METVFSFLIPPAPPPLPLDLYPYPPQHTHDSNYRRNLPCFNGHSTLHTTPYPPPFPLPSMVINAPYFHHWRAHSSDSLTRHMRPYAPRVYHH